MKKYTSIKILPLYNFSMDFDSFTIDEQLTIRKLTQAEKNKLFQRYYFNSKIEKAEFNKETNFAIIQKIPFKLRSNRGSVVVLFDHYTEGQLFRILKLFKAGHFQSSSPFYMSINSNSGIRTGEIYPKIDFPDKWKPLYLCEHKYLLSKKEKRKFKEFFELYHLKKDEFWLPIDMLFKVNVCDRFNGVQNIFDIATALECLLVDDNQEITYKLSTRAATLLGKNYVEKNEIRLILRHLYGVRSYFIHGVGGKQSKSEIDLKILKGGKTTQRKKYEKIWNDLAKIGSSIKPKNENDFETLEILYEEYLRKIIKKLMNFPELHKNPELIDNLM